MSALFFSLPLLSAQARAGCPRRPRAAVSSPDTISTVVVHPLERPHRHLGRPVRRAVDLDQGAGARLPGMLGRRVAADRGEAADRRHGPLVRLSSGSPP